MKEHPILFKGEMVEGILAGIKTNTRRVEKAGSVSRWKKGDRLWVKEKWVNLGYNNAEDGREDFDTVVYAASENGRNWQNNTGGWRWKSSLFMRKQDSRISLDIVNVHREPLQNISEEDAKAEGIGRSFFEHIGKEIYTDYSPNAIPFEDPRKSFKSLWEKINGADSWNQNPIVTVIEFKIGKISYFG